jgi:hypothetical protein
MPSRSPHGAVPVAALALAILASTAIGATAGATPDMNAFTLANAAAPPLLTDPNCDTDRTDTIVVCRRPRSDRYRIPEPLRATAGPSVPDERNALLDPRQHCTSGGAHGCGHATVPVLTIQGGKAKIGH